MGLKFKLNSRLADLARQLPDAARARTQQLAEEIAEQARANAPVKTGALRDSIHVETNEETGVSSVVAAAPYSGYVEYGTHKAAAQPFLRPAVETVRPTIPEHYEKLIE